MNAVRNIKSLAQLQFHIGQRTIKVRLTNAQVQTLRETFKCYSIPVQYAGAIMYWQGAGWYEISQNLTEFDWAEPMQAMKAMLKRIRQVLCPEDTQCIEYTPVRKVQLRSRVLRPAVEQVIAPVNLNNFELAKVTPVPFAGVRSEPAKVKPTQVPQTAVADPSRLEALRRRINNKFHRA